MLGPVLFCLASCGQGVPAGNAEPERTASSASPPLKRTGILTNPEMLNWAWEKSVLPSRKRIYLVQFPDASNGWVGEFRGQLYHTVNGGRNWLPVETASITNAFPASFCFASSSLGLLA